MNAGGVDKACKSSGCSFQHPVLGFQLMNTFRFLDLRVYRDAKVLHRTIVRGTKDIPREFFYLKDQIRRAALSVVLNIAEGSGKSSSKDFNRYVQNSLGSVNEVAACVDITFGEGIVLEEFAKEALTQARGLKNALGALSKKLKS